MTSQLSDEFRYYLAHQSEFVDKYSGKFVVIKNDTLLGVYDDEIQAVAETRKNEEMGTFLVQLVTPGEEAYTQTFHSRVTFA